MFKISNFTDNDDVTVLKEFGAFKTIEWKRDLSVNEASAMNAYFASEMNVRRRQVICDLSQAPVTVQAGAMQWMVGNVTCTTGVKGVGDRSARPCAVRLPANRPSSPNTRAQVFWCSSPPTATSSRST